MKIKKLFNYLLFFVFVLLSYTPVYAEEVVLKNARVVERYGEPSIETISIDNNTITSGIKFNNINEFVTLELELENNSNNSIELESIENLISSNYLNVETDSIGTIINRSSSNNIRVKITYNNELLNQDEIYFRDASIKFNFSVIPMENPNTSSALVIIIKIVLLLNIGFSLFILLKRKKKLAFLGLFFIPLLVYAKDSKEVIINFDDIRAKGRFEEYSVIITNENGEIEERTITYGEPVELPSNVSKTGYNFTGWVDQNGNSINNGDIITGETEITPTFEIISYTITYNLNNGTLSTSNPTTYTIEDEFTLNNPTRVGYSFSGWMEGNDGVIISSMTIYQGTTGNKTFTAIYSPNPDTSYKVIHKKMDLNGEYGDDVEEEILHGSTGSQVTPQRIDYTGFIAPEGQRVTIAGDGSTTVTYYYEREQYTFRITDRTYIVSGTEDGSYYYGTTINIKAQERVGYTFKWSDNNTDYEREFTLSENTILTPKYIAQTVRYRIYHCYMNLDGETYNCGTTTQSSGKADSTVVAYIHSREGFTDPEPETITIAADGSTTHRYYYTRNKYQLTLTDSEYITTSTPSGEYFYETNISLTAKTREGYTFAKWSDDSVSNPYSFQLLGDKTIGPVYTRNQYTITLDPNGGSVDPNELIVDIGSSIGTLPTPTINQNHTTFLGWFTGVETGDEVTENTIPEGNITIYARWEYHPEATFENGPTVNKIIKKMSGNITSADQYTNDNNIEQIKVGESLPNGFTPSTANTISTSDSDEAIYIWYDSNDKIMYYYTDAEKIYLNKSANVMFRNIRKLSSIENINNWDTSKTTDMTMLFDSMGYNATTFEINLSNWNTSSVTSMTQMFSCVGYNATTWSIGDISNWDTSKVTNMSSMFYCTGYNATTWSIGDLSDWNVSSVTNMSSMFFSTGYKTTTFDIGDLSNWNTSNVTSMSSLFSSTGHDATTWSIGDISNWKTSNVTNMSSMFSSTGYKATTWSIGDLSNWDTSKVTNMSYMFQYAGYTSTSFEFDLSNWNVSNVTTLVSMFNNAGRDSKLFDIGDISNWNTLNVTTIKNLFYDCATGANIKWYAGDFSNWKTSKITDMSYAFFQAYFKVTSPLVIDLSGWDTSNVTDMNNMFYDFGRKASSFSLGDLSNWNVSKVTNMYRMFKSTGYEATTWSIGDISRWNTKSVTDMSEMFCESFYKATTFELNLSNWNVSNVNNMKSMFSSAGYKATTWSIGDISNWNVSNATNMSSMFYSAGYTATTFELDLSDWNTSQVTDMGSMFNSSGYNATTWSVGNLSSWNVSKVTSMGAMFKYAGKNTTTFDIGDLSNWDTTNVTNMQQMFTYVGNYATTWNSIGHLKVYATSIMGMFSNCKNAKATITFYNKPTSYMMSTSNEYVLFYGAATAADALITVNYTSAVDNIDDLIATKSSNSHVVKGSLITTS